MAETMQAHCCRSCDASSFDRLIDDSWFENCNSQMHKEKKKFVHYLPPPLSPLPSGPSRQQLLPRIPSDHRGLP